MSSSKVQYQNIHTPVSLNQLPRGLYFWDVNEVMLLKNINSLLLNLHFTFFAPYSLKMAFHYFAVDLDLQMRSHIWHTTPQIEQKSRRWNLQLKSTADENFEV